ncbi:UDP-glucose/GDP-mannose dehydrogenase family protein [Candidatus Woesearchaeota archaeon]|nr:UDP-glucose/GDP-mannose dehydrogenase family protein [Candidatus Woesearchaeota archaeon]
MRIAIIGTGYVGLTVGTCLSELGNDVICVDIDQGKIDALNDGDITIYEPGLEDMLNRNFKEKRISFTTDSKKAIGDSQVIFIAVGTPPGKDHKADLSFVKQVAKDIGTYINGYKVVVDKSTVPVGTAELVKGIIEDAQKARIAASGSESKSLIEFDVVSNPEFLREGEAINDFMMPDRVIIGTESEKARKVMEEIYKGIARTNKPIMFTCTKSAEIIKYASNAMLATRISFMNEIARLCEKAGGDVKEVAKGMGLDSRIGPRFLQAGAGYGGSCFPKDVKALAQTMNHHEVESRILQAVEDVNEVQKISLVPKVKKLLPELDGKAIAVWGLAFKPKTDDMREAPSIVVISELQKEGARIRAFDPEAQKTAKKILDNVEYLQDPYEAVDGADALVIMTEWNEFRSLDKKKIKSLLKGPNIIDGRNVYEPKEMKDLGFNYIGVGRR